MGRVGHLFCVWRSEGANIPVETITSGVPKTKSAAPTVVSLTDSASITRAAVTSAAKSMGEATQTSTSKGAAPTLGPMGMGAALVGVAGFVLAAL